MQTKKLTLVHDGGSTKRVLFVGVRGLPLQAWIAWPLAGEYAVSVKSGRMVGIPSLRRWRLDESSARFVRAQARSLRRTQAVPVAEHPSELRKSR